MKLHQLKPRNLKKKKRKGRGISAGKGKTCGRGTKGQKSRSGEKAKPGFEGGQMPLIQRLPKKRGFCNIFSTSWQIVNVGQLNQFKNGTEVNTKFLIGNKLIKNLKDKIKILGDGILEKKLKVYAHSFSQKARKKIEKAGGKAVIIKVSPKNMGQAPVSQVSKGKSK